MSVVPRRLPRVCGVEAGLCGVHCVPASFVIFGEACHDLLWLIGEEAVCRGKAAGEGRLMKERGELVSLEERREPLQEEGE